MRSYTKKRHIQEANEILQKRIMVIKEQSAPQTPPVAPAPAPAVPPTPAAPTTPPPVAPAPASPAAPSQVVPECTPGSTGTLDESGTLTKADGTKCKISTMAPPPQQG